MKWTGGVSKAVLMGGYMVSRCRGVKLHSATTRHPELVSGSILPHQPKLQDDEWTLKQVQGDGGAGHRLTRITSRRLADQGDHVGDALRSVGRKLVPEIERGERGFDIRARDGIR